jgi:hypothetical protein
MCFRCLASRGKLRGYLRALPAQMAAVLIVALAMPGCTTLRGAQNSPSVFRPSISATCAVGEIPCVSTAISNFYGTDAERGNRSPLAYRNVVLTGYIQLIESDYDSFVDRLNSGERGTALGFDLLQLGLTGATGLVAENAVKEMTTVLAVVAGARASIDKRLFYDRTMTALIASMDAERAGIMADIATKRRLTATEYSLDDAVYDLNRLIDAGNLNRAFSRINRNAEADLATEVARLNNIPEACADISVNEAALRQQFRQFIDTSDATRDAAVREMAVTVRQGEDLKAALRKAFAIKFCGEAAKRELLDKLNAAVGN